MYVSYKAYNPNGLQQMLWEKEDEQDGYHTECDGIVARRAYSFVSSVFVLTGCDRCCGKKRMSRMVIIRSVMAS
ncbi:MAG: hypothetical protein MJZ39_02375 [Bacteroidales bacterium]|nr:hypothetical protein [Bacteroidales bacterium]